jgi:hypothetical protein
LLKGWSVFQHHAKPATEKAEPLQEDSVITPIQTKTTDDL